MKYRRIENSHLSRSPHSSPPYKISLISDEKSKQLMNGQLSPLHTRRGPLNDLVTSTPDFAEFDYLHGCSKLLTITSSEDCQNVAFSDLDKLQIELEQILAHTTDHQKKIYGEITFLTTGDYPTGDISSRLMPVYELKTSELVPSCSKEIEREPTVEDSRMDGEINWLDEGFDVWPPVNLSQKFWVYAREYLDPIDEEYLHQWWSSIVQLFSTDNNLKSRSEFCPVALKKSTRCEIIPYDRKSSSLPSFSKWNTATSLHRNRSFISSKNSSSSPVRLKLLNNDSSPPPNKIARYEKRPSSQLSGKTISLLDDLVNAYVGGKNGSLDNHCNGVLLKLDKKNCPSNKELNANKRDKVIQEVFVPQGVEQLVRKCGFGKRHSSEDEVSVFFKKLQAGLTEKEIPWRGMVAKIWHRLLAEYLRMKLEQSLDKADQEMFEVYDKYYSEFPKRRPMNEQEREECRYVLQRRNDVAQTYYDKVGSVKDLKLDICSKGKGMDSKCKMCFIKNVNFCSRYEFEVKRSFVRGVPPKREKLLSALLE